MGLSSREGKIIRITQQWQDHNHRLVPSLSAEAGMKAAKVGNVGDSFSHYLAQGTADWYVCELSSFQLEDVIDFRPEVAIILNITPDHLDRYDYSLDKYAEAKMRIVKAMKEDDILIYNAMDPVSVAKVVSTQMEPRLWSIRETDLLGDEKVYARRSHPGYVHIKIDGKHNQVNLLTAARFALLARLSTGRIARFAEFFINEAHRMELAGEKKGVRYINDSKATNVQMQFTALGAMKGKVIWIAGGLDKGNDYGPVMEFVRNKIQGFDMSWVG
jgi:UDP-N-acetylmuramoylalanine--D-glutamate ligase